MKPLLVILSNPLVLIALWALFIWLLLRSPLLAWVAKLVLLLGWGAATAGVTLFVIITIYLPKEEYFAALAALLVGGFISLFWVFVGIPEILKTLRAAKGGLQLWKS